MRSRRLKVEKEREGSSRDDSGNSQEKVQEV